MGHSLTKCPGWPHPQQTLGPGCVLRAVCSETDLSSLITSAISKAACKVWGCCSCTWTHISGEEGPDKLIPPTMSGSLCHWPTPAVAPQSICPGYSVHFAGAQAVKTVQTTSVKLPLKHHSLVYPWGSAAEDRRVHHPLVTEPAAAPYCPLTILLHVLTIQTGRGKPPNLIYRSTWGS